MDYDVCIGCAYCAVSCPYQARTIVHDERWYYGQATAQEREVRHEERFGVAQKCTFCIDRVDIGVAQGLTPGVDPSATPACSAACIAQAIHFGDFNDPNSNVSRLARDNASFQMHAELGTDPQIKYLYSTPAVPGRDPGADDADEERLSDPANPLVGQRQTLWDWRAAMNWCFGGASSGLAVMATLFAGAGWLDAAALPRLFVIAAALMAIGLFFVFLKIGRKLRFWRAVSRPHTSWMSRELYAVALFYPAVLAALVRPQPALYAIVALSALAFLICQAKILHRARGIPAWRVAIMPWLIVASGLLEGVGLLGVLGGWMSGAVQSTQALALGGALLVLVNAALWNAYRSTAAAAGMAPRARAVIAEASIVLHGLFHLLPAAMFGLAWGVADMAAGLLVFGGLLAVAGGAFWKFTVIVRAAYQQGFALAKYPQRGSGTRAAPVRLTGFARRAA
jgi:DMSO reductase anchor subunit/ferredoxin